MYTLQDYETAKEELERWERAWDNYSGNNPDKHRSAIAAARSNLRTIRSCLQASGQLPRTEAEDFEHKIDKVYPKAQHKDIVEYEGKRYQRIFYPLSRSRSGKKVQEWGKEWREVLGTVKQKEPAVSAQAQISPPLIPAAPEPIEYLTDEEAMAAGLAWTPVPNPRANLYNNLLKYASEACYILAQARPGYREELLVFMQGKVTVDTTKKFSEMVAEKWLIYYGGAWPLANSDEMP